jgi:hypothetical protein
MYTQTLVLRTYGITEESYTSLHSFRNRRRMLGYVQYFKSVGRHSEHPELVFVLKGKLVEQVAEGRWEVVCVTAFDGELELSQ